MKKCSTSLSHKGNANQNYRDSILLQSEWYHQEHKQEQMLVRMYKKEPLHTIGWNVN
jgi:hypothetical protein